MGEDRFLELDRLCNMFELMLFIRKYGKKTAIMEQHLGEIKTYTYDQLYNDIMTLAYCISETNMNVTYTVIVGENSYHWIICYFAIVLNGGTVIPLDVEMSDSEIVHTCKRMKTTAIFYSDEFEYIIPSLYKEIRTLLNDTCFNSINSVITEFNSKGTVRPNLVTVDLSEKIATIVFSSGTTGANKGVMLTHNNILSNQYLFNAKMGMVSGKSLLVLPMHHLFGLCVDMLGTLYFGDTLCIGRGSRAIYDDIKLFKPDRICLVPSFLKDINKRIYHLYNKKGYGSTQISEFKVRSILKVYGEEAYLSFIEEVKQMLGITSSVKN